MKRRRLNSQESETEAPTPATIGFRLDEEYMRFMRQKAESLHTSVGELARSYVLDMLCLSEQLDRLGYVITNLWEDSNKLRRDLALSVETLLVISGKVSRAEAEKWVDKNLKSICSQSPDQCRAPQGPTTT